MIEKITASGEAWHARLAETIHLVNCTKKGCKARLVPKEHCDDCDIVEKIEHDNLKQHLRGI